MVKTYSNLVKAQHPRLKRLSAWMLLLLGAAGIAMHIWNPSGNETLADIMFISGYSCLYFSYLAFFYSSRRVVVDDEAGTMTTNESKSPMMICKIDRIIRHYNKKGRLRYINIHEGAVRFVSIRLKEPVIEELINDLQKINPSIAVKNVTYL